MNKSYLVLSFSVAIVAACSNERMPGDYECHFVGIDSNLNCDSINMLYVGPDGLVDTTLSKSNFKFQILPALDKVTYARLFNPCLSDEKNVQEDFLEFFLVPGKKITSQLISPLSQSEVMGELNDDFTITRIKKLELIESKKPYEKQLGNTELSNIRQEAISKKLDSVDREIALTELEFYKKHNNFDMAANFIMQFTMNMMDPDTLTTLYNYLGDSAKAISKPLKEKIDYLSKVRVGSIAPEIKGQLLSNESFKLSDQRGKYILLEFWGSWCKPCREENPALIETYNRFKSDRFEILGIAMEFPNDNISEKWMNAVKEDGLLWPQILDTLGFMQKGIVGDYGVMVFPTKYLVGPEGKVLRRIVGENSDLDDILSTYLTDN